MKVLDVLSNVSGLPENEVSSKQVKPDLSDNQEIIRRFTAAMREADQAFEKVGGSTRHYVRDCLLPILEKHDIEIIIRSF